MLVEAAAAGWPTLPELLELSLDESLLSSSAVYPTNAHGRSAHTRVAVGVVFVVVAAVGVVAAVAVVEDSEL